MPTSPKWYFYQSTCAMHTSTLLFILVPGDSISFATYCAYDHTLWPYQDTEPRRPSNVDTTSMNKNGVGNTNFYRKIHADNLRLCYISHGMEEWVPYTSYKPKHSVPGNEWSHVSQQLSHPISLTQSMMVSSLSCPVIAELNLGLRDSVGIDTERCIVGSATFSLLSSRALMQTLKTLLNPKASEKCTGNFEEKTRTRVSRRVYSIRTQLLTWVFRATHSSHEGRQVGFDRTTERLTNAGWLLSEKHEYSTHNPLSKMHNVLLSTESPQVIRETQDASLNHVPEGTTPDNKWNFILPNVDRQVLEANDYKSATVDQRLKEWWFKSSW